MSNAHQKRLVRLREAFERAAHKKPFEKWIKWLLDNWPKEYKDRATPPKYPTARLPGSRKKVSVMRRRCAAGVSLYHEKDVGHQPDVSIFISVLANGSPVREGLQSESASISEAEEDMPDELPTPQLMTQWLRKLNVNLALTGSPCQHVIRDIDGRSRPCGWTYTIVRDGHTFCTWCHGLRRDGQ